MTQGRDDGASSGSDSEPSADNLDEEEMAQICPEVKKKKPIPKPEEKKEPPKVEEPPKRPVVKEVVRPVKKPLNPFDRLSLRKRKPEMKDAWT